MKKKTNCKASQDNKNAREELGARKVEIIVCYIDEYATDVTDILNKIIQQEVS